MAKVYFRYGPMSCGKSERLISEYNNYFFQGKDVIAFTSILDNRYSIGFIRSRNGMEIPAILISKDKNIYEIVKEESKKRKIYCVFIDEFQFFDRKHVFEVCDVADKLDIPVIVYGLLSDFRGEIFDSIKLLLAYADKKEELKTVCWFCNRKALFNMRIDENGNKVTEGEQICVGDINYIPVCRKCYINPPRKVKRK